MESFDEIVRGLDLGFFGSGKHKISIEKSLELVRSGEGLILDVRTNDEHELVDIKFATCIPANEVPDRLGEIPEDKEIAVFCSGGTRAAIIYAYLRTKGFENVKIITDGIGDIAGAIKPGYVLKKEWLAKEVVAK